MPYYSERGNDFQVLILMLKPVCVSANFGYGETVYNKSNTANRGSLSVALTYLGSIWYLVAYYSYTNPSIGIDVEVSACRLPRQLFLQLCRTRSFALYLLLILQDNYIDLEYL